MENNHINFIDVKSAINWDEYFMLQAIMASFKSKDPATKVGCVFVDQNNHQITFGYNGFVAGIDETKLPWGKDKTASLEFQKYGYVVHAEANAILHTTNNLSNAKCYVTLFPCHECAKLLASSKVSEIIYLQDKHEGTESNRISKKIFELTGIKTRKLELGSEIIEKLTEHFSEALSNQ
ncbi:dCMP deaminase family protein [Bacteriovorax sp. Seq25_V]|uniref:deoxycytidylate deaminase n=1 Tax=Bacteriovorax sp. Seq25_V TaxID=1201288 RepID=UPI00038A2A39|nr:dCMP deaminase family protein [Bacteriovorax sp. Seq25_V]EQC47412.1 cytidine and deoxycytidylate deaminase zinc-binding region [Bacteriovorax sp. Seq25_V]